MQKSSYTPPFLLKNGLVMTVYTALQISKNWQDKTLELEPPYQEKIFTGAGGVPIFGIYGIPENPKGTIIATYGIVGDLDNQWFLKILGRKAFARGYGVVLFDWRAHGKTGKLSSTLQSDGLYEGEDFVKIALESLALGCPAPIWFLGFSLGGQLALWGVKAAQTAENLDIAGAAVICPSLDSNRSLTYLEQHPLGKYLEKAITRQLQILAHEFDHNHPNIFNPQAIARINSIRSFDQELVIERLGFSTVEDYFTASSGLQILPQLQKPTFILYAEDDPLFDPTIIPDLKAMAEENPAIDLWLTKSGGHVCHISSKSCKKQWSDRDPWWAWNRILDWFDSQIRQQKSVI